MAEEEFCPLSGDEKEEIDNFIASGLAVIDADPNYFCNHCGFIAIFHNLFSCSHLYCKACSTLYIREKRKCKKCCVEVSDKTSEDKKIEQEIFNLKAECPNKAKGCANIIKLRDLLTHTSNCKYSKVKLMPNMMATKTGDDQNNNVNKIMELEAKLKASTADFQERIMTLETKLQVSNSEMNKKLNNILAVLQKQSLEIKQILETKESHESAMHKLHKNIQVINAKVLDLKADKAQKTVQQDDKRRQTEHTTSTGYREVEVKPSIQLTTNASPSPTEEKKRFCQAQFNYEPVDKDELQLVKGMVIEILSQAEDGWLMGKVDGRTGMFPSNYVVMVNNASPMLESPTDGSTEISFTEGKTKNQNLKIKREKNRFLFFKAKDSSEV